MAKSVLILDMPDTCEKCPICRGMCLGGAWVCAVQDKDGNERFFGEGDEDRPDYCPLREVPIKINHYYASDYQDGFAGGWNACIDKILGGWNK